MAIGARKAFEGVSNIADRLGALYRDGQRYWSGVQPDPLAEYLIGTVLKPEGRSLDT